MRSSNTLDCAVELVGLVADASVLPFLELSALEVRRGTTVLRSCRVGWTAVAAFAAEALAPSVWEPLAARKAVADGLGSGGAFALTRC